MTRPPLVDGGPPTRPAVRRTDGLDTLHFDSTDLPPDLRFDHYRQFYARGADTEQIGPGFAARVFAVRLDGVNLYDRHLNDVQHRRSPFRVDTDGFDHLTVTLVLSGTYEMDSGDGYRTIPPGCAMVIDTLATMRARSRDAHIVTVAIGRTRFVAAIGVADGMHGHFIGAADAVLTIDYVQAMLRRVPSMSAAMAGPATHALLTLIAASIGAGVGAAGGDRGAEPSAAAIRDAIRIARVRTLADENIADPDFGADQVIAQCGVSRATLYRLFRAQGGIAGYIRSRRLEALRMALADPADQRSFARMVTDTGLKSEAHASRLFRDRFGLRPGDYRSRATDLPPPAEYIAKMVQWQENLKETAPVTAVLSHS